MSALNDVGGEKTPHRRITANCFRLLTARLKKRPTAFAQTGPLLEPIVSAPVEIQENLISAPLEEAESEEEFSSLDPVLKTPEVLEILEKKPWAWLTPADPVEAPAFDPLPEFETPVQATEDLEPLPEREPWAEIPFEELFAASATIQPEPEIASPEPELISVEPETASPEPEIAAPEPAAILLEPEAANPEPEIVAPVPELVSVEPETASPEPEIAAPEPVAVSPEPEATNPEPVQSHPNLWQFHLQLLLKRPKLRLKSQRFAGDRRFRMESWAMTICRHQVSRFRALAKLPDPFT